MVKFLIYLKLNNYKKIKFYKFISKIIKHIYNSSIYINQKKFKKLKTFNEPLIRIKKHIFNSPNIEITFEFKMNPEREEIALTQFHNNYNINKSYKDLKVLFYSTKIIQFVNILKGLITYDILWKYYVTKMNLKTNYKPNIKVSDAVVLSL